MKNKITLHIAAIMAALFMIINTAGAQCIDCGTGADGAFLATTNTTLAGGTYNFSSFIINAGVTVSVTGNNPLIILCTGTVSIQGTLTASGGNGSNGITFSTYGVGGVGVAGGANGGDGVFIGTPSPGVAGLGTGAGGGGGGWSGGGGAGYAAGGASSGGAGGLGGIGYGNVQISPVVAGSGGGGGSGGNNCGSGGGGAGGGVISIATCSTLNIGATGAILCNGGNGGTDGNGNCGGGGGGSGGSIWLISNNLNNMGTISAIGGIGGTTTISGSPYWGNGGAGSVGRVRLDYYSLTGGGTVNPPSGYSVQPSALTAIPSAVAAVCHGGCTGVASVNVLTGTPPYTYLWSTGCTAPSCAGLCAGSYTVTVTDVNGCINIVSATVTEPGLIAVTTTGANTVCAGHCDTLLASASGGNGNPFTYVWSPAPPTGWNNIVCPLVPTTYTVVASDSLGCTATTTTTVNALPLPVMTLSAQSDTVCSTSNINILFGTPPGGNYFGTGVGGNNFNAVIAGMGLHDVNYRYTGSNGCSDTMTIYIFVESCTGIEAIDAKTFVNIFPNPSNGNISIQASEKISQVEISNVVGEIIFSSLLNSSTAEINFSAEPSGIYFMKLKTEKGIVLRKLMKD